MRSFVINPITQIRIVTVHLKYKTENDSDEIIDQCVQREYIISGNESTYGHIIELSKSLVKDKLQRSDSRLQLQLLIKDSYA